MVSDSRVVPDHGLLQTKTPPRRTRGWIETLFMMKQFLRTPVGLPGLGMDENEGVTLGLPRRISRRATHSEAP